MSQPPVGDGHRHTVLIVDDADDVRDAFAILLRTRGFDVTTSGSGADALAQLRRGLRPCLMLLDLRMPDVDGWDVMRQINADPALAGTRIVVVTGDFAHQQIAQGVGVTDTLLKPVDPDALTALVAKHCPQRT